MRWRGKEGNFEVILEHRIVDVLGGNQQTIKMLYNLNERMPITGLRVERFPPTPAESNVSSLRLLY